MSTRKIKNLTRLLDEQESLLKAIKTEAQAIESQDLLSENEKLEYELQDCKTRLESSKTENEQLKKELAATKSALFTKLANEKLQAFENAQRRIENMYYMADDGITSRLREYEYGCRKSLDETINAIDRYASKEYSDIQNRLSVLRADMNEKSRMIESRKNEQLSNMARVNNTVGERLKNEPLSDSEKRVAAKEKSLESFIGLNVLSKAGILLFLVGIVLLGRYAYVNMSDMFKGIMIYALGGVLLAGGEILHKKEKTVFSQALISGSVAVFYAAAATGHFAFHLYGETLTFVICVWITALAILLSNQLKSQIVCGFAAVGGYLPVVVFYMITFGKAAADKTFLPVSCVYFCALAAVIFLMTYNKKWYVPQFIGYGLHLIAIGGVASCAYSVSTLSGFEFALPLAVAFSVVSFIIYILMPGSKIVAGKTIGSADIALLALNTLSGAISVSVTIRNCFESYKTGNRAMGFVFLIFALIYALLMVFSVREKKNTSLPSIIISSVGTLIFSMLVVPLIFGMDYAPIAWVSEGVIIAIIGMEKEFRIPELAGFGCMIAALLAALINADYDEKTMLTIITFSVIVSAFWIYLVRGLSRESENVLYIVIEILVSIGTVTHLFSIYQAVIQGPNVNYYSNFTNFAVAVIFTLIMAIILRFGVLRNGASLFVSDMTGIALVFVLTFAQAGESIKYNAIYDTFRNSADSSTLKVINLILLAVLVIGIMVFFTKASASMIEQTGSPVWTYTFAISMASLMVITATIMKQFDIRFTNVIISAIYIAAACVMLFIGFKKSYTVVRSGGLVLVLVAFAKLCFVDTFYLDSKGWKILAYFAFGAVLIGISYVYQRFSKKLENNAIDITKEEQDCPTCHKEDTV